MYSELTYTKTPRWGDRWRYGKRGEEETVKKKCTQEQENERENTSEW